jgi:hypothetical protein
LALLAAAFVVPTALADNGRPVAGYNAHLQELTAMANSYRTQASRIAPAGSVGVPAAAATTSGSFDWVDAGIGAMSGLGVAFAAAVTLLFVLRRRPRGQGPRTQTTA